MALAMIEAAEADGRLPSGRLGRRVHRPAARACRWHLVCAVKGYSLQIVTSDAFAREKLGSHAGSWVPRLRGCCRATSGGMTATLTRDMVEAAARAGTRRPGSFWTDQLSNADPLSAPIIEMAEEIWAQTDGRVDGFVQCVGTAGCGQREVGERFARTERADTRSSPWSRPSRRSCRAVTGRVRTRSTGWVRASSCRSGTRGYRRRDRARSQVPRQCRRDGACGWHGRKVCSGARPPAATWSPRCDLAERHGSGRDDRDRDV